MWKVLSCFPMYEINEFGVVRNYETHYVITQRMNRSGYLFVMLFDGTKYNTCLVHRLVAETFIPNPEGLPIVNHIDECCVHNSADNLEWVSYKGNSNHGTRNERIIRNRKDAVLAFDDSGKTLHRFSSKHEAARALNVSETAIREAIKHHFKCKTFYWRLDDKDTLPEETLKNQEWIRYNIKPVKTIQTSVRKSIPVLACDADGNHIKRYASMSEAAKDLGVSGNAIKQAIINHRRCKTYYWEYAE